MTSRFQPIVLAAAIALIAAAAAGLILHTGTVQASGDSHDGVSDDGRDDDSDEGSGGPRHRFMTGSGAISGEIQAKHGFDLQCDVSSRRQNLEVNWGRGNKFHLETVTSAVCSDDPSIDSDPSPTEFDTLVGAGTGRYNGVSGSTAQWTFKHAGERGKDDAATIVIKDASGAVVLSVSGRLKSGRHQCHNGVLPTPAPTATSRPAPTSTPAPEPTSTPIITETPVGSGVTPTPAATATSTSLPTPTPTATPSPTSTSTPEPPAHLMVIMHVVNDNGGTVAAGDFTMTVTGETPSPSSFPGSEAGTTVTIGSGGYSITHASIAGYSQTDASLDCSGVIAPGETRTCTIMNDDVAPQLTLGMSIVNDNGGARTAIDWTLTATGPTPISGVTGSPAVTSATVNAGTYTLSESGPSGYTSSAWSCVGGAQTGNSIALAPGQSADCTSTADDSPAHLTVINHVVNDDGGSASAGAWTMNVAATTPSLASFAGAEAPGTTITLNPGTFSVFASGSPASYRQTGATGCSGTIAQGETRTCLITNNDFVEITFAENSGQGVGCVGQTYMSEGAEFPDLAFLHVDGNPATPDVAVLDCSLYPSSSTQPAYPFADGYGAVIDFETFGSLDAVVLFAQGVSWVTASGFMGTSSPTANVRMLVFNSTVTCVVDDGCTGTLPWQTVTTAVTLLPGAFGAWTLATPPLPSGSLIHALYIEPGSSVYLAVDTVRFGE